MAITAELHDGTKLEFPDDTPDDVIQRVVKQTLGVQPKSSFGNTVGQALTRGVRDIIDRPAAWLAGQVSGPQEQARVEGLNKAGMQEYQDSKTPYLSEGLRMGGQIAATGPIVGAAGRVVGTVAPQVGRAISTFGAAGPNLPTKMAGGAVAGGMSAGMVNPDDALTGALIGGAIPPVAAAAGAVGRAATDFVRPFTQGGREKIAGQVLRGSAENADQAISNLRGAASVIPGSVPTTAAASGDFGLAATLNAVQDKIPEVGSAARRAADTRNIARTEFGNQVGGDSTTISLAKTARDQVTEPIRMAALKNAASIDLASLTGPIDKLMSNPQMQGETVQAALNKAKSSIERIAQDGKVNPVALYEIRKDINLAMMGKLEGEAGNLKFARAQLMSIKQLIDNRIDAASQSPGAWKGYLSEYAGRSKEIGQMETVQDVLRRSAAGTVDSAGNPMLYASKLNSILKNEGAALKKQLKPEQMDALRKLAADLSAEQLAASASRSSTLNSVTNKLGNTNSAIDSAIGIMPGGGLLTRAKNFVQSGNKEAVMGLLGDSVLSPELAAYLMQQGAQRAPRAANGAPLAYRAAPLLPGLLSQQ